MSELNVAAKANGLKTGIALPAKVDAQGTWADPQSRDYAAIGKVTDEFVPMTYDEHWSTSGPGNITSPGWADDCMKYAASVVPSSEVEVGYPAYGYDWVGTTGSTITWAMFQDLVQKYKVTPVRDTDISQELRIDYTDEKGARHEAWITDSLCLEAQANIVKREKLYGLGVWYFGSEDESFWSDMKQINATPAETHLFTASDKYLNSSTAPLTTKDFFSDRAPVDYVYAGNDPSCKIVVVEKEGKRWADITLKATDWSFSAMGFSQTNLTRYLPTGALQLYIRGAKGGENFTVGFIMAKGSAEDEKYSFETSVKISDYAKTTTQWQLVTIPLSDFPVNGRHWDDKSGASILGPFKWDRTIEFGVENIPGSDQVFEVQIASVRVIPTYDKKAVERAKFAAMTQ